MRQHLVSLVKLEYVLWYLIFRVTEFLQYNDGKETNDTKYIVKTQFRLSVSARHTICNVSVTLSAIHVYVYESQKNMKKTFFLNGLKTPLVCEQGLVITSWATA